jgi:hypothetical protein
MKKEIFKLLEKKLNGELESVFAIDSFPGGNEITDKKEKEELEESNEKPERKLNILIDFDGPIHKYSKGFNDGTIYDVPTNGVKKAIDILSKYFRIVIFTARLSLEANNGDEEKTRQSKIDIEKYLKKHNIYYDDITCIKIPAVAYIDDMAIQFDNWIKTLFIMKKFLKKIEN